MDESERFSRVTLLLGAGFPWKSAVSPPIILIEGKRAFLSSEYGIKIPECLVFIIPIFYSGIIYASAGQLCLTALNILAPKHDAERIGSFHRLYNENVLEDKYGARYSREKSDIRNSNLRVRSAALQPLRKS